MDQGQIPLAPPGHHGTAKAPFAPALLGARDKDMSGSVPGNAELHVMPGKLAQQRPLMLPLA